MSFNITMPKITQQIQPDDLNLAAEDNSSPLSDYFSLTRTQRLYAFGICAVIGLVLCALSLMMLGLINLAGFAIFYSLGNVVAILGTMFLVGPMRQLKMAFEPVRIIATIVFIITLVLTFIAALVVSTKQVLIMHGGQQ
ncbi:hypothetical protein IWQ61_002988 [Dispira simplex]|nr:hypothetical protein IWQ61_002988 [Dispira simplex]